MNRFARKRLGFATFLTAGIALMDPPAAAQPPIQPTLQPPNQPRTLQPPPTLPLARHFAFTLDYDVLPSITPRGVALLRSQPSRIADAVAHACHVRIISPSNRVATHGSPGQVGFNIAIVLVNPPLSSDSRSDCVPLREVQLFIGSTSGTITVGSHISSANGQLDTNGNHFDAFVIFDGLLSAFSRGGAHGDFRILAFDHMNPGRALLAEGRY